MNQVNTVALSDYVIPKPIARTKTFAGRFQDVLEKVSRDQGLSKDEKELKKACQELESVLLYQMIRAMRATVPKGGLIDEGFGGEVFESMLDEEFARQMAMTGSSGLADLLFSQLNMQKLNMQNKDRP